MVYYISLWWAFLAEFVNFINLLLLSYNNAIASVLCCLIFHIISPNKLVVDSKENKEVKFSYYH